MKHDTDLIPLRVKVIVTRNRDIQTAFQSIFSGSELARELDRLREGELHELVRRAGRTTRLNRHTSDTPQPFSHRYTHLCSTSPSSKTVYTQFADSN